MNNLSGWSIITEIGKELINGMVLILCFQIISKMLK